MSIIIIIIPPASPRAHTMGRTREVTLSSPSARLPALQAPYGNLAPSEKEQILQHPLSTPFPPHQRRTVKNKTDTKVCPCIRKSKIWTNKI